MPVPGGCVAKLRALAAAVDGRTYWVAMVAMLAAAVAAFVYLRILVAMYLRDPEADEVPPHVVPPGARVVVGVACAGVLFIGLLPAPLLDLARQAVPVLVGG